MDNATKNLYEKRNQLIADLRATEDAEQVIKIGDDLDLVQRAITAKENADKLDNELRNVEPRAKSIVAEQETRKIATPEQEMEKAARDLRSWMITGESRAITTATSGDGGGYMINPQLSPVIMKAILNANVIRGLANVMTLPADIKVPVETGIGTAGGAAEGNGFTEVDSTNTQATLAVSRHDALQKVSLEFLQDAGANFDVVSNILTNIGLAIGIHEELAFIAVLAAAATSGATTATTTAITTDNVIDLFHSVPQAIRPMSKWIFSDDAIKTVSKLKEAGQWLFQPGMGGTIDMIKGKPVVISSNLPTVASGAKVAYFGDYNRLWVSQRDGIQIMRNDAFLGTTGLIHFQGWIRSGAVLVQTNAIKYLQMGTNIS